MVRVLISLKDEQLKKIDRLARKKKQSRAQVIREAIEEYVSKKENEPTWEELVRKTAGIWKHKNIDTDAYLEALRSEWDR